MSRDAVQRPGGLAARGLPVLAAVQVVIAVITVGVALAVGRSIPPLITEKQQLEEERETLRAEVLSAKGDLQTLQTRRDSLAEEIAALERVLRSVSSAAPPRVVEDAFQSTPRAAGVVGRLYIYMSNESQRERWRHFSESMRQRGYVVPELTVRGAKRQVTELRYFHDSDKGEVAEIGRMLEALNVGPVRTRLVPSGSVRFGPRHYEIWLGSGGR
jgi:hypothetical protein